MQQLEIKDMQDSLVVAIDGPAASGKGTLARSLAEQLSLCYLDTGSLYRAVGYLCLQKEGDPANEAVAVKAAQALRPENASELLSHPDLRTQKSAEAASKVAAISAVRKVLLDFQRDFAYNPPKDKRGAVLDGRDIGTVICPEAPVKLYITASPEVRAERRFLELKKANPDLTKADVLEDIRIRDARDSGRQDAPMKPAEDALIIDTSILSAKDVLDKALAYISEKVV